MIVKMISLNRLLLLFIVANLSDELAGAQNAGNETREVNIGVVLDWGSPVGKLSNSCIPMALSDFYASHSNYTTRLLLHYRDSNRDAVEAASAALDLLTNVEAQAIIGPQTSTEAEFVIDLGDKAQVPIVSFSATSPSLSSTLNPYFVRTKHNDSSQVKSIAAIVHAFGWREVVTVYEDSEYGKGVIPYLIDALQEVEASVSFRSVIPSDATDDHILEEIYKLMTMQTRVFIVHVTTSLGSRLFLKAQEAGMMETEYAWIVTDGIIELLESMDSSAIDSLQGVVGVKHHIPKSKARDDFTIRWKQKFRRENPDIETVQLNAFGLWAYDTVWALAMAAEQAFGSTTETLTFQRPSLSRNSTDLSSLGVSSTGPKLLDAILRTRFMGLGGSFQLNAGQLQTSALEIVNVIGKNIRVIGFWNPITGLSRNLNQYKMSKTYTTSMAGLETIIWPGYSTVVPRGWVIPTNGKKLKIGVPIKEGFQEFVKVEHDSQTNRTIVSGFCKDVFDSVLEILPYAVPHEFIPFDIGFRDNSGTYNDLSYQVYLQKFDAVMGDVTIIANRSKYVDFTQPYTESGVRMIVPVKTDNRKNALIFLKPLTWELWVTSGAFFLFTGIVVWFLEHRISPDFNGSLSQQLGVIFWFSFSTMVFAHKETLISNLSKFVVIIWLFVVLILTSSYTASLTSMLTVQKLQPTVTDFNLLIKNRDYVGYPEGSFVKELLRDMKFEKSKLKPLRSSEEYADLLSKGSRNGGVAAIFHELPYIELFLSKYCNNYTMAGPTLKTGGFGFVFPKGSPLVSDFSRAILNVTQGNQMVLIKRAWFGHETTCPDPETTLNSNALSLGSFWGLFLITGMASVSALIIFLAIFLYNNRDILTTGNMVLLQRIIALAKKFDQKDISSNTFQNTELRERMGNDIIASDTAYDTSNQESPLRSLNNHEAERNIIPNGEGTSPTACSSPRNSVLADEIYMKDGHN